MEMFMKEQYHLLVENVKGKDLVATLIKRGFDSDPVKKWQAAHNRLMNTNPEEVPAAEEEDAGGESGSEEEVDNTRQPGDPDFDYLVDMSIRSLTLERKNALEKKRDEKLRELEELKSTSLQTIWLQDIQALEEGISKYETAKSKKEQDSVKQRKSNTKKKYTSNFADDLGEVIDFKAPAESTKVVKPRVKKEPGEGKVKKEPGEKKPRVKKEKDDMDVPLSERMKNKRKSGGTPQKKKKKNPWETDSENGDDDDSEVSGPTANQNSLFRSRD
eukprot:sb/3468108/